MKVFTLSEANQTLLSIRPSLERIKELRAAIASFTSEAKTAASAAQFGGGGVESGSVYVNQICEFNDLTAEIEAEGVQVKDYGRGLIDFPSFREGRMVLLCWQFGEGDEIKWWHDLEAGFAGRQPIDS